MKKQRQCSRQLPKPLRIWQRREDKGDLLRFVIYPDLTGFKLACEKCKFKTEIKTAAGTKRTYLIKDKDFNLKYYHIRNRKTWVGTVPPTFEKRHPELYAEVVSYFDKHRARGFRRGVLLSESKKRTKLLLAGGKTSCLPDKSIGNVQSASNSRQS